MPRESACPSVDELRRLALGLVEGDAFDSLEHHVLGCQGCVETISALDASDTLVQAVQSQPEVTRQLAPFEALIAACAASSRRFAALSGEEPTSATASADEPTSAYEATRPIAGGAATEQPTAEYSANAAASPPDDPEAECYDFLARSQAADELGRLAGYRLLRVLGAGGMGTVFEAEDVQLKRRVALKVMKPALAASRSSRQRFLREAQTAAAVEHDHIVPIYQVGEDRGTAFIAMPLLRGESLAERLAGSGDRSEPLAVAELLRVGREIATGLEAAHRAGLIHRDIKPGNIWLEERTGRVKLLDFGLARAADGGDQLTQPGAMLGTPSYMAPEQARGDAVDTRADLFSLGCVMYQMAVGRRPFEGRDALSALLAVSTQSARPPREPNPELPEAIERLILQLLEKDPAARIQSAEELIAEIRRLESPPEQTAIVADPSVARESEATPVEPATQPAVHAAGQPPRNVRRIAIAAAAAAACILCGVFVIKIKHRDGTEESIPLKAGDSLTLEELDDDAPQPDPKPRVDPAAPKARTAAGPEAEPDKAKPRQPAAEGVANSPVRVARRETPAPPIAPSTSQPTESTAPLSSMALVTQPTKIEGVKSWTIETVGPRGRIYRAEYSHDGKLLATLGIDATLRLWDAASGTLVRALIGQGQNEGALAWSSDSARIAAVDVDAIRIWEASTGRLVQTLAGGRAEHVYAAAWSPDGKMLAVGLRRIVGGSQDERLEIWDLELGELLETRPADWSEREEGYSSGVAPQILCWSPDSQQLAFHARGGVVTWRLDSDRMEPLAGNVGRAMAWRADGALLTAICAPDGDATKIELWRADAGERRFTLSYNDPRSPDIFPYFYPHFSPDGSMLLAAAHWSEGKTPWRVFVWNTTSGELVKTIEFAPYPHLDWDIQYALSPQGASVAAFGPYAGNLRIINGENAQPVRDQKALLAYRPWAGAVSAWSPEGRTLATCVGDNLVSFWDSATWRERALTADVGRVTWISSLAWSSDGLALGIWNQERATFCDPATGQTLYSRGFKVANESFLSPGGD